MNAGIRILAQLRDDDWQHRTVRNCWKDQLTTCFGPDLYNSLIAWAPTNPSALQLARHLEAHSEDVNMPLLAMKTNNVLVRDPEQEQQMLLKLVDLYASFLDAANKMTEEGVLRASASVANVDFESRYFATAMRDLQRAVD